MIILAIDPGCEQSGYVLFDGGNVTSSGVTPNHDMLELIGLGMFDVLAVEMMASYGKPVGKHVFEACVWTGRFIQRSIYPEQAVLLYRKDVKMHLCGASAKVADSHVRQAILDRYPRTGGGKTPQVGTQAKPGPLFGVSQHAWSALGVAITAAHHLGMSEAA